MTYYDLGSDHLQKVTRCSILLQVRTCVQHTKRTPRYKWLWLGLKVLPQLRRYNTAVAKPTYLIQRHKSSVYIHIIHCFIYNRKTVFLRLNCSKVFYYLPYEELLGSPTSDICCSLGSELLSAICIYYTLFYCSLQD